MFEGFELTDHFYKADRRYCLNIQERAGRYPFSSDVSRALRSIASFMFHCYDLPGISAVAISSKGKNMARVGLFLHPESRVEGRAGLVVDDFRWGLRDVGIAVSSNIRVMPNTAAKLKRACVYAMGLEEGFKPMAVCVFDRLSG